MGACSGIFYKKRHSTPPLCIGSGVVCDGMHFDAAAEDEAHRVSGWEELKKHIILSRVQPLSQISVIVRKDHTRRVLEASRERPLDQSLDSPKDQFSRG